MDSHDRTESYRTNLELKIVDLFWPTVFSQISNHSIRYPLQYNNRDNYNIEVRPWTRISSWLPFCEFTVRYLKHAIRETQSHTKLHNTASVQLRRSWQKSQSRSLVVLWVIKPNVGVKSPAKSEFLRRFEAQPTLVTIIRTMIYLLRRVEHCLHVPSTLLLVGLSWDAEKSWTTVGDHDQGIYPLIPASLPLDE